MQFEIAKPVLTGLADFTAESGRFANLFVHADGDHLRIVAAHGAAMAMVQLKCGQGEKPLLPSLSLESGEQCATLIMPIQQVLSALKDRDCEYVVVDQPDADAPVTVRMDTGLRLSLPPSRDELFDFNLFLEPLRIDNLLATSHLGINPTLLAQVSRTGKRLGIENPTQLIVAMSQTSDSRTPGPLGVMIANCDWFYAVVCPQKISGFRSELAMPPAWCYGDYSEIDLPDVDHAIKVSITQPTITGEQLAMDFDDDPCTSPDPLLKFTLTDGAEVEMKLSDMLKSFDVDHYIPQLSDFHLRVAYDLATSDTEGVFYGAGFQVDVLLEEEGHRRDIDLEGGDVAEETPVVADDATTDYDGPYHRAECPDCAVWEDARCVHGDGACILDDAQTDATDPDIDTD